MEARQQSWPRIWLMTDERMGERLWSAIDRLPDDGGIVFRHYSLGRAARGELAQRVAEVARRRAITLAVAGDEKLAELVAADLIHNPVAAPETVAFSRSVHSIAEAQAARAAGAALVFVSPVYATRSHPGNAPLGPDSALEIARAAKIPALALGGMDARKFARLERDGFYGWAGIDAWIRA